MADPSITRDDLPTEAAPPERSADVLPPGTVVGRYVILHVLGQGAAGLVYAAYDGVLDRKLALKFLRVRGDDRAAGEAARRLRREAQAMARLSHPNVVSIHDVGDHGGEMFLVMDLVGGGTLRQWLTGDHSWRDRLKLLCKAGDGLAAAHAAGIVHRDFKPANVLVDGDEPRVTDFGVAAAEHGLVSSVDALPAEARASLPPAPDAAQSALDTLRQTDGLVGTIGYLAPEQAWLEPVDARSDQFAFCATAYLALHGVLPFPTDGLLPYVEAARGGKIRPPPSSSPVPRAVHATIVKGLSAKPADRFPSMEALLVELRRDRDREAKGRAIAIAILAVVVASIAFGVRSVRARAPMCAPPDDELGGVWTAQARERIAAAFGKSSAFASTSFAPLAGEIGRYAHAIAEMRTQSCVATRVRGEQTDGVMMLRSQCLDGRARELGALVRMLAEGDDKLGAGAAESLSKLSSIEDCADVASLTAPIPPPTPAIASAVKKAREELSEIHALWSAGRYAQASSRAAVVVSQAEVVGYAPLVAEAKYELGAAQDGDGKLAEAEKSLRSAIDVADEGHHDLVRGEAYVLLAQVIGRGLGHYETAIASSTSALHIARRIHSASLEAEALQHLGTDHGQSGMAALGLEESRAALALEERLYGPDDFRCAGAHVAASIALSELDRAAEAEQEDRRALEIYERTVGPAHPRVGITHANLALDLVWSGRPEAALAEVDRALAVMAGSVGKAHPDYAMALNTKGYALTHLGRFADAMPFNEEAVRVTEKAEGLESAGLAYPLVGLGEELIGLGRAGEAIPLLERATRIAEANELDAETMGECHYQLARALRAQGLDEARVVVLARKALVDYGRTARLAPRAAAVKVFLKE